MNSNELLIERSGVRRTVAVALVSTAALVGCTQLKQVDEWAMNKALEERGQVGQLQPATWTGGSTTVPPEAGCRFSATYKQTDNCCLMPRYTTSFDVDTAFARARVEYGFREKRPLQEGKDFPGYHGFAYETHPGALYRMFGEVVPRSDVRLSRGVWIGLVISKASATTAEIEPVYCEIRNRSMRDQLIWHKAVQDSVRATLPPADGRKAP